MRALVYPAALLATAVAATAASPGLVIRSGRWEKTSVTEYGPERPRGIPASVKSDEVERVTKTLAMVVRAEIPGIDPSCKDSQYRAEGRSIKFTAACEDSVLDLEYTFHSADGLHCRRARQVGNGREVRRRAGRQSVRGNRESETSI